MNNRFFASLLVIVMMLSCLTACGGGGTQSTPAGEPSGPAADASSGNAAPVGPGGEYDVSAIPEQSYKIGTMVNDPAASKYYSPDAAALTMFCELVNERSGGKITITPYWGSVLGHMDDMYDMMRTGDLEMSFICGSSSSDNRFGAFNMPYLFDDLEMVVDLIGSHDSPMFPLYQQINHENNVHCLSGAVGDLRELINNKKLVKTPEDMKGMLVRVYNDNTVTTFWNGLCDTATLPIPEVYTALQLGTVDGMEFGFYSTLTNGFVDVVDYCTVIKWQWSAMPIFMMSKGMFDELDPVSQAILEDAAQECMEFFYTDQNNNTKAEAEGMLTEQGVEIYYPTAEELGLWQEYGRSLYPQFRETYGAELVDEVIRLCDEYRANR